MLFCFSSLFLICFIFLFTGFWDKWSARPEADIHVLKASVTMVIASADSITTTNLDEWKKVSDKIIDCKIKVQERVFLNTFVIYFYKMEK